ncbi:hypothetical protein KKH39_03235 [Patescibacteria group bacterium]|nr:hypothetical protein [Patescibacteria group bacterium]
MSQGSIDREGAFIDITVPVEFAQEIRDRLSQCESYTLDQNNCHQDQEVAHIRIILKVMSRGACYQKIKEIGQELGISVLDKTAG